MNFILLFGPPAVGKMTVGQELTKLTDYKLFHNHMTIDLVTEFFDYGTPQFHRLVPEFRRMIIREAAKSALPGLIFTMVWALDLESDKVFADELRDLVTEYGGQTFYAELESDLDSRLYRNRTENRVKHKKKADFAKTEENILQWETEYKMNTNGNFPYPERHVKINNTHLTPKAAALQICAAFDLRPEHKS